MMIFLLHDYILRRNIKIESATANPTPFVASTHGSHHVHLVDAYARFWNSLINAAVKRGDPSPADIHPLPELPKVDSGESFGLVKMSPAVAAQQSFVTIKDEPDDGCDLSAPDLLDAAHVLGELGIDPALLNLPLPKAPGVTSDATAPPSSRVLLPPEPRLQVAPQSEDNITSIDDNISRISKGKQVEVRAYVVSISYIADTSYRLLATSACG